MAVEKIFSKIEDEEKDDEKSLVEHLVSLRMIVAKVLSGDIETGMGVSATVGSRRFDPQNQTARSTMVTDDSSNTSDDSNSAD